MRVLVTGASGNIGRGVVPRLVREGHDVVLSDLLPLPDSLAGLGLPFHQLDVQAGFGLERAAEGCDLILHTPAWHGIHWQSRTEADFWRLNVDGTFWTFQAARGQGVSRVVFLSSQAWHGHYDKYGFTKRIGEELCEYHRCANGIRYVAVRPADLTPWRDWANGYGARLLYGGVDREDVLESIVRSIAALAGEQPAEPEGIVVNAVRANAFADADLEGWESDPIGACERLFPGSSRLVERYRLDIAHRPSVVDLGEGASAVGYVPRVHFGEFLGELARLDVAEGELAVRAVACPY